MDRHIRLAPGPLWLLLILMTACGSPRRAALPIPTANALATAVSVHARVALTEVAQSNVLGAAADATIVARADAQLTAITLQTTATARRVPRPTSTPTRAPATLRPRTGHRPTPTPTLGPPARTTINGDTYRGTVLGRCCSRGQKSVVRVRVVAKGPWAVGISSRCSTTTSVAIRVARLVSDRTVDRSTHRLPAGTIVIVRPETAHGTFTVVARSTCRSWLLLFLHRPVSSTSAVPRARPTATHTPTPRPASNTSHLTTGELHPVLSALHAAQADLTSAVTRINPNQADYNPQALQRVRARLTTARRDLGLARHRLRGLSLPASGATVRVHLHSVLTALQRARVDLNAALTAIEAGDTATASTDVTSAQVELRSGAVLLRQVESAVG